MDTAMLLENGAATILNGIDNATETDLRMLERLCEIARTAAESHDPTLKEACASACRHDFTEEEADRIVRLLSSFDDLTDACRNTEADPDICDRMANLLGHWSSRLAIKQDAA